MQLLNPAETRVVFCLVEKEATTPDTYPLSLNAIVTASNQTTNREPIVNYDQATALAALDELRYKGMAKTLLGQGRVAKYRHMVPDALGVDPPELALLCVLGLRGPQTAGELRARTERLSSFDSLSGVEAVLTRLAERDEPLVMLLPRRPGHKEPRWAHLLEGPIDASWEQQAEPAPNRRTVPQPDPAFEALEERVVLLESDMAEVRALVSDLRSQLGLDQA